MVRIAFRIVVHGVLARVGAGGDGGGVVAAVGAVHHGAAVSLTGRHQGLGTAVVGQGLGGGDRGHRGLGLGDLEGGGAADGVVAACRVHDGDGGGAHLDVVGIADGVLVGGDQGVAVLDGDNLGLDLAAGMLEAGSVQLNGGAADHLGIDGDGQGSDLAVVGNGQFRHAGVQLVGADGHLVGHDLGLVVGAVGGDHHAGLVKALAVGVDGLVGGLGHVDALNRRILRHGQGNAAGGGGVVGGIVGGEGPGIATFTRGQVLARVQRQGAGCICSRCQLNAGKFRGVENFPGAAHRHTGHGGLGLGDGDLDLRRVGVAVVGVALDIVPDGVLARVDAGGNGGGVVALLAQPVHHGAAGGGARRHQFMGLTVVGQVFHGGGGGAAGSRVLNG